MEGLVKVGITGAGGFISKTSHIPGFAKTHKCIITGFHDVKKDLAENAKALYLRLLSKNKNPVLDFAKDVKIFDDLKSMVNDVDVIDICTPPRFHMDNLQNAVDGGKHIICEKPLAINWWELNAYKEIPRKMTEKGLVFMLHTQGIWHPIIKAGRDMIASGEIGAVERVRMLHQGSDPKHTVNLPSLWEKQHSGGGALVDIGPHAFAGMWYWLGGKCNPESVEANLVKAVIPDRSIAGAPVAKITVEDDAHISIIWKDQFGKEIKGDLESSWNKKDWFEGKPAGTDIYYEATGTKGTLSFPHVVGSFPKPLFLAVAIKIVDKQGKVKLVKFPIPKKKIEDDVFFDEVGDVILRKTESRNNYSFAADMLAVFGAAYLSRKNGGQPTTIKSFQEHVKSIAAKHSSQSEQVRAIIDDLYNGF